MPQVEVFESDEDVPLFTGEFSFLPRLGEIVSKEKGGYFSYYRVIEVWHRERPSTGEFRGCLRVALED